MIYRIWNKTFTGYRFVDTWGVSREKVAALPGVELVIGPTLSGTLSCMFRVGYQNAIKEQLESIGCIDYDTAAKARIGE